MCEQLASQYTIPSPSPWCCSPAREPFHHALALQLGGRQGVMPAASAAWGNISFS